MPKQRNQLVLLDRLLDERQSNAPKGTEPSFTFEVFSAEQALTDYELSEDEIKDGIVGGGQDGGIDSIYVFLDRMLLTDDADIFDDAVPATSFGREIPLTIVCIQSKRTNGFAEAALVTAKATIEQLLDLSASNDDLKTLYNAQLVDRVALFKHAVTKLAPRHPRVTAKFVYATRGDHQAISTGALARAAQLKESLESTTGGESRIDFLGAEELWKLANTVPSYTLQLPYQEDLTEGTSHAALVDVGDYIDFLTASSGNLQRHIFEMNVRDYQGNVEVNREISKTLLDAEAPEFWWMNNGITIVCSHVTSVGKVFQIDDVQIVNGLQTSFTLFETLKDEPRDAPVFKRRVLIRLLVTSDAATRDRVIRATNSQTKVPPASLRATDDLQREIEAYLLRHNWFYDRRKNYYKNIGKPRDRIVSIPLLAQAMISVGLGEPNQARARPSTLLKNDSDYERVFPPDLNVMVYRYCLELQKSVDARLLVVEAAPDERNNLRFHASTVAIMQLLQQRIRHPSQLTEISAKNQLPTAAQIDAAIKKLKQLREDYIREFGIKDRGQIAKSADFVAFITANLLKP